jgi:hypothetical protein
MLVTLLAFFRSGGVAEWRSLAPWGGAWGVLYDRPEWRSGGVTEFGPLGVGAGGVLYDRPEWRSGGVTEFGPLGAGAGGVLYDRLRSGGVAESRSRPLVGGPGSAYCDTDRCIRRTTWHCYGCLLMVAL